MRDRQGNDGDRQNVEKYLEEQSAKLLGEITLNLSMKTNLVALSEILRACLILARELVMNSPLSRENIDVANYTWHLAQAMFEKGTHLAPEQPQVVMMPLGGFDLGGQGPLIGGQGGLKRI